MSLSNLLFQFIEGFSSFFDSIIDFCIQLTNLLLDYFLGRERYNQPQASDPEQKCYVQQSFAMMCVYITLVYSMLTAYPNTVNAHKKITHNGLNVFFGISNEVFITRITDWKGFDLALKRVKSKNLPLVLKLRYTLRLHNPGKQT